MQEMTGAYLRVKREDGWQPIEVEHLTDQERQEQFQNRPVDEILRWMNLLCEEVARAEKILDDLVKDGVLERK